jgi:hypothetical protein
MPPALSPIPNVVAPGSARPHRDVAPKLVGRLYRQVNERIRAEMLDCLLRPLNPLGLVAIARGAFAPFLDHRPTPNNPSDMEAVSGFTSDQITALAEFVEQVDPQAVVDAGAVVTDHAAEVPAYSTTTALLLMQVAQASGQTSRATSTTRSSLRH